MKALLFLPLAAVSLTLFQVSAQDVPNPAVPPPTPEDAREPLKDEDFGSIPGIHAKELIKSCLAAFNWNLQSAGDSAKALTYDEMWDDYILPVLAETNLDAQWKSYMYSRFPSLMIEYYLKQDPTNAQAIKSIKWMMALPKVQYEWLHKQIVAALKKADLTESVKW